MKANIEYYRIDALWEDKLCSFFKDISLDSESSFFHPHPFDNQTAKEIAAKKGKDLYFLQVKSQSITGYGILRGWDEGYVTPTLGIIIHPFFRRQGMGKKFMHFLHDKVKEKGVNNIMLKVYEDNVGAIHIYKKMGYQMTGRENKQLVFNINFT